MAERGGPERRPSGQRPDQNRRPGGQGGQNRGREQSGGQRRPEQRRPEQRNTFRESLSDKERQIYDDGVSIVSILLVSRDAEKNCRALNETPETVGETLVRGITHGKYGSVEEMNRDRDKTAEEYKALVKRVVIDAIRAEDPSGKTRWRENGDIVRQQPDGSWRVVKHVEQLNLTRGLGGEEEQGQVQPPAREAGQQRVQNNGTNGNGTEGELAAAVRGLNQTVERLGSMVAGGGRDRESLSASERLRSKREFYEAMWGAVAAESASAISPLKPKWMDAEAAERENSVSRNAIILKLNNAVAGKARNSSDLASLIGRGKESEGKPTGAGVFTAKNGEMAELFDVQNGAPRVAAKIALNAIFEPTRRDGVFGLRLKNDERAKLMIANSNELRKFLIGKLLETPGLIQGSSEEEKRVNALEAATLAMSFLYVGNIFEASLDGEKSRYSAGAMVDLMFPEAKAKKKNSKFDKYGEDLGEWLWNLRQKTESRNLFERGEASKIITDWENGRVHYFPEKLFYDFFSSETYRTSRGEETMLEALYNGDTIDFGSHTMGIEGDPWSADYYDFAGTASSLLEYATGKQKYDTKDPNKWVRGFYESLKSVAENDRISPYVTQDTVRWMVVNSIGLAHPDRMHSGLVQTGFNTRNAVELIMKGINRVGKESGWNMRDLWNKVLKGV